MIMNPLSFSLKIAALLILRKRDFIFNALIIRCLAHAVRRAAALPQSMLSSDGGPDALVAWSEWEGRRRVATERSSREETGCVSSVLGGSFSRVGKKLTLYMARSVLDFLNCR